MNAHLLIVPHSHWDREWYDTYENFRFYLVQFMDDLIESLERDHAIPGFLLDGQMILVDDYLEIKPEMKGRFARLAGGGRITLGPWYVQPDEFLVSGESLVRNLQIGIAAARGFGEPMMEGYVPDTFGHIPQLPQILRGVGIGTFYAMRGLGADVEELGSEFLWEAPDGSSVRTHYLVESYSNGGVIARTPEESVLHHGKTVSYDTLYELIGRMERRSKAPVLLILNGSDHTALQANLSTTVAALSRSVPARLGLLEDYSREIDGARLDLKHISGELRYGRYHPILKGVFSARTYLKQLNSAAEEHLSVEAERFSVMASASGLPMREPFLLYAWKRLIENHAHDSICGCSVDRVHDEVVTRLRKSLEVSKAVADEAIQRLAVLVCRQKTRAEGEIPIVVFNPSPWARSGSTSVTVHPLLESPLGARRFGFSNAERDFTLDSCRLENDRGEGIPFTVGGSEVTVKDMLLRRKVLYSDTLSFHAEELPPMGYRVYTLKSLQTATVSTAAGGAPTSDGLLAPAPVDSASAVLDNGLVRVTVGRDGTFTLRDIQSGFERAGLNEIVDDGDAGDEYTFSPPRQQSLFSSKELAWTIRRTDRSILAAADFVLPAGLSDDRAGRSQDTVGCRLETRLDLEPGSRLVRITTTFDNACLDHRLRARFATGLPCDQSVAETPFGLVRRPTTPEGNADDREWLSNSHAQRRFAAVEAESFSFILYNKGLPEYEVTPDGEMYLTLLRGVGWLSRDDLSLRPGQVGPELPTPGAQCIGRQTFQYAVAVLDGPAVDTSAFRLAEEYIHPLRAQAVQTALPVSGNISFESLLSIEGDGVVVSALRPRGAHVTLRLFNPTKRQSTFTAHWGVPISRVESTNLLEEEGDSIPLIDERSFHGAFAPCAIATYRVSLA